MVVQNSRAEETSSSLVLCFQRLEEHPSGLMASCFGVVDSRDVCTTISRSPRVFTVTVTPLTHCSTKEAFQSISAHFIKLVLHISLCKKSGIIHLTKYRSRCSSLYILDFP